MDSMSIFSFNNDAPVNVPVDQEVAEEAVDVYADVEEEDYTSVEEPDFGDDV